jgi:effector-binding domain-containing protein
MLMYEPELKEIAAHTAAYLPMRGPYAQTPEGYGRLYGWIAQHGLVPEGMPGAVYLTMPSEVPESDARWELIAPVAGEPAEREPDEDGVGIRRVGPMTVASVTHVGPYETVGPAYAPLFGWLAQSGYRPAGPPMEVYYSDPATVAPSDYVTEIRIPIAVA